MRQHTLLSVFVASFITFGTVRCRPSPLPLEFLKFESLGLSEVLDKLAMRLRPAYEQSSDATPAAVTSRRGGEISLEQVASRPCTSHDNCTDTDEYCAASLGPGCYVCRFCSIGTPIDGVCPEACMPATQVATSAPTPSPTVPPRMPTEEELACVAATNQPCVQLLINGGLRDMLHARTRHGALGILRRECTMCESAADEFNELTRVCNATEQDQREYTLISKIFDNACADRECAGAALWAANDLNRRGRREALCPMESCTRAVLDPFMDIVYSPNHNMTSLCSEQIYSFHCMQDQATGAFCAASLRDNMNIRPGRVTSPATSPPTNTDADTLTEEVASLDLFCGSNCMNDMSKVVEQLQAFECELVNADSFGPSCEESRLSDFSVMDICTSNDAGAYCVEIMPSFVTDACELGDSSNESAAVECSSACLEELERTVADGGCCVDFALELSCAEHGQRVRDFVSTACGVDISSECARPAAATSGAPSMRQTYRLAAPVLFFLFSQTFATPV